MTNKEIEELRIGDTIEVDVTKKEWSWRHFDYIVPDEKQIIKVMISNITGDHEIFWYGDNDYFYKSDLLFKGKLVRKIIDTIDDDLLNKKIEEKKKYDEAVKNINERLSKRSLSSIGTHYEYIVARVIDSGDDLGEIKFLGECNGNEFWSKELRNGTIKFDYYTAAEMKAESIKNAFVVKTTVYTHIDKKFELV